MTQVSPVCSATILGYSGHMSGPNGHVDLIVVHGTVSPCVPGGARGVAHYFQGSGSGGLAHAVVDPGEVIATCSEDVACWHAPPNIGSLGFEFCDWQGAGPDGDVDLWADHPHQQMLGLGARWVRDVANRHGVDHKRWLSVADLLARPIGARDGITSHENVSKAYHKTNHTDPGRWFPVEKFMGLVAGDVAPVAPHQEEDVVFICEFIDKPGFLWMVRPQPMPKVAGRADGDPYHRFGTREHVSDEPTFWRLASHGIPVRSSKVEGMELYAEVV